MSSRGCHLDLVPDLTTSLFIQCFWPFTCHRRLYCRSIYTDRGTKFVGCDAKFKTLEKHCFLGKPLLDSEAIWRQTDCDHISRCMSRKGVDIHWNFNVAKNPHAGGNWERAIQSDKCVFSAILYNGMAGMPAPKTRYPSDFALLSKLCEI